MRTKPVKLDNVGEVIATRTLSLLRDHIAAEEVLISLGKPQTGPDHQHFNCTYQIRGAGVDKTMSIYGVDSFQALHLALSTLTIELEVLNKELGGKLRWECDDMGGLGFPGFEVRP